MNARFCGLLFAALTLMLLSLSRPVQAQQAPEYLYLTLDAPNGQVTFWGGINNEEEIVGQVLDAKTGILTGILYQNGVFTEVPIPNATSSYLSIADDHGTIVGVYTDQNNLSHSFLRAPDGTITYLPDVVSGGNTYASEINDNGVIVGGYTATPTGPVVGFIYRHGIYTPYNFPGATYTFLSALRDQDLIVGYYTGANGVFHSFVLAGDVAFPIVFPGPYQTFAVDINNLGDVVGEYFNGKVYKGYLLSNGVFHKITFPGSVDTYPDCSNDDGEIAGSYVDTQGVSHGFVAIPLP